MSQGLPDVAAQVEEKVLKDQDGTDSQELSAQFSTAHASSFRKALCLAIFCVALFIDAFMTSAMIICLDQVYYHAH